MRMAGVLVTAALVVSIPLGTGACTRCGDGDVIRPNWSRPPGDQVGSAGEAREAARFELHVPRNLGHQRIFVLSGGDAVFFAFRNSTEGIVWVAESAPDIENDDERLAAYRTVAAGQKGTCGNADLVHIRGGIPALLSYSDDEHAYIEWVEGGVQFNVRGPSISRERIVTLANRA